MLNFFKQHFDLKIYPVTWLVLASAIAVIPSIMYLSPQFGYENGLLENIQMLVLFIGTYLCFSAKTDKKFFIFAGLVLSIIILREVNCGRTLFFHVPGTENAFYSWKQIKYGYLAHPIFGIYIASVAIYFLKNKLFLNLWYKIRDLKLPLWNILFLISGLLLSLYAEKATTNFVFEEISELLMYVSILSLVWLYSRNKNFINE